MQLATLQAGFERNLEDLGNTKVFLRTQVATPNTHNLVDSAFSAAAHFSAPQMAEVQSELEREKAESRHLVQRAGEAVMLVCLPFGA